MPQSAVPSHELAGIADRRRHVVPREQVLIKEKLRVQVLLVRPLVDDCHGPERIGSALCLPFGPEDLEERSLDLIWFHRGHRQADGLGATHPLGPRQHRVEQRAAGIRVDLDELRTRGAQVKVVPQETAGKPGSKCAISGAHARAARRNTEVATTLSTASTTRAICAT